MFFREVSFHVNPRRRRRAVIFRERRGGKSFSVSALHVIVHGGNCIKFLRKVLCGGYTPGKTIRKGRKRGRWWGWEWEISFRSLPRTNFRRCTFTASAIVSLHTKLDYRPTVIVLQHLLVGGQGHVLRIVLFPIMFSTKFAKHRARKNRIFASQIGLCGFLYSTITYSYILYLRSYSPFYRRKRLFLYFRANTR